MTFFHIRAFADNLQIQNCFKARNIFAMSDDSKFCKVHETLIIDEDEVLLNLTNVILMHMDFGNNCRGVLWIWTSCSPSISGSLGLDSKMTTQTWEWSLWLVREATQILYLPTQNTPTYTHVPTDQWTKKTPTWNSMNSNLPVTIIWSSGTFLVLTFIRVICVLQY